MKTKFFAGLIFFLLAAFPTIHAAPVSGTDDIKVVVSDKKIWVVADEMPVKCLCIKIKDAEGKVVAEKSLSSKISDWSLNVENLPKGDYTVEIGKDKKVKFHR